MSVQSQNIIRQLLSGRQHSDLIVIRDDEYTNGIVIAKEFVDSNLKRENMVHLLAFENEQQFLEQRRSSLFLTYHCFSDPWDISDKTNEFSLNQVENVEENLRLEATNLIIIDSLNCALLEVQFHKLLRGIKKLIEFNNENRRIQILAILHKESLPESSLEFKQLNKITKSVIDLEFKNQIIKASVQHRKTRGKIIREVYVINENGPKLEFKPFEMKIEKREIDEPSPMNLTTFKLSLEEEEKEKRSQVVLPYIRDNQPSGKGRIFYEPDDNDDWDDEDPDDDLEI